MNYVTDYSTWSKKYLPDVGEVVLDNCIQAFEPNTFSSRSAKGRIDFPKSSQFIQHTNFNLVFEDLASRKAIYLEDMLRKFVIWGDPLNQSIDRIIYCLLREIYSYFLDLSCLEEPFIIEGSMKIGEKIHRVLFLLYVDKLKKLSNVNGLTSITVASSIVIEIQVMEESFIERPVDIISTPNLKCVNEEGRMVSLLQLIRDLIRRDICRDLNVKRPRKDYSNPLCPFTDDQLDYAQLKFNRVSLNEIREHFGYTLDYSYRPWFQIRKKCKSLFEDFVDFDVNEDREVLAVLLYFNWINLDSFDLNPTWRNKKRPSS